MAARHAQHSRAARTALSFVPVKRRMPRVTEKTVSLGDLAAAHSATSLRRSRKVVTKQRAPSQCEQSPLLMPRRAKYCHEGAIEGSTERRS